MPRPIYIRLFGTLATFFQFGGPTANQIKLNAGRLECRNGSDTTFVPMGGLDAIQDDEFVTKRQLRQTYEAHLEDDQVIGAPDVQDLLVVELDAAEDGRLIVLASVSSHNTGAPFGSFFFLEIDGVQVHGTGLGNAVLEVCQGAINRMVPVASGHHTVKLQWRTDPGTKTFVEPVSRPDAEHASLVVQFLPG